MNLLKVGVEILKRQKVKSQGEGRAKSLYNAMCEFFTS